MLAYYEGKDEGRAIVAPRTKGPFVVTQSGVDDISKGKNLAGKTYKGAVPGMPNNMTGPELVSFWIDKASAADKGFDAANGYDYPQLISKFIIGAVFYNQAVDNYLDEGLRADKHPNDKPYKEGAAYTGKEHAWDEAFGYFGTPAHTLTLTPGEVYEIAKQGAKSETPEDALALADHDQDGAVDLKSEMTFAPAYYAASFDKSGSRYLHTIAQAFLDGRRLITAADGAALSDAQRGALMAHAETIRTNWEKVLAEAVFKYAGSVYEDLGKLEAILESGGDPAKAFRAYVKHWGELKGFALALQTGRDNLGETAVQAQPHHRRRPGAAQHQPGRRHRQRRQLCEGRSQAAPGLPVRHAEGAGPHGQRLRDRGQEQRSARRHGVADREAGRRRQRRERLRLTHPAYSRASRQAVARWTRSSSTISAGWRRASSIRRSASSSAI